MKPHAGICYKYECIINSAKLKHTVPQGIIQNVKSYKQDSMTAVHPNYMFQCTKFVFTLRLQGSFK